MWVLYKSLNVDDFPEIRYLYRNSSHRKNSSKSKRVIIKLNVRHPGQVINMNTNGLYRKSVCALVSKDKTNRSHRKPNISIDKFKINQCFNVKSKVSR